jgi:hypothetical protein
MNLASTRADRRTMFLLALVGPACGGRLVDIPEPPDGGEIADAPLVVTDASPNPGTCTPTVPIALASGQSDVTALASDGMHVFWLETTNPFGSVKQCAVDGCGGAPSAFVSGPVPLAMALDGANIYWLNGPSGTVSKCPTSGCGSGGVQVLSGLFNPWPVLAAGDGEVFVAIMPPPGHPGSPGTFFRCPESGCGISPTTVAPVGTLGAACVGGSNVYWRDAATGDVLMCDAVTCTTPAVIASNQGSFGGIAATASAVYWTSTPGGAVMTCPSTGRAGAPTTLAGSQASPGFITADATGAYWANGDGDVMACGAHTCAQPKLIAKGAGTVTAIALDVCNVYWATTSAVWKASR